MFQATIPFQPERKKGTKEAEEERTVNNEIAESRKLVAI
jgi:hypothetical protein